MMQYPEKYVEKKRMDDGKKQKMSWTYDKINYIHGLSETSKKPITSTELIDLTKKK